MKNVTDNMTTAANDADIRQDNRRALPKYLLILLCSAVAGGAASFTISSTFLSGRKAVMLWQFRGGLVQ